MSIEQIEQKVDRAIAGAVAISDDVGGIKINSMAEVFEMAKLMAVADVAVPPHCRGKPGVCLAVCIQAIEWRMSPFAVANKSYTVNNKGVERIAYESQLIHAVIEARAPLKARLRHEIIGEGEERRCKVWGTFRGEAAPHEYVSETLATIIKQRGRNDYGAVKGSPLWDANPEVQLFYWTSRIWARLFCPDVILGIYGRDELPDDGEPVDVTPTISGLAQRLADRKKKHRPGFDEAHVVREASAHVGNSIIEGTANSGEAEREKADVQATNEHETTERTGGRSTDDHGGVLSDNEGGSGGAGRTTGRDGDAPAEAEGAQAQIDFPGDRPIGKGKSRK